jgi:hypothetical protein
MARVLYSQTQVAVAASQVAVKLRQAQPQVVRVARVLTWQHLLAEHQHQVIAQLVVAGAARPPGALAGIRLRVQMQAQQVQHRVQRQQIAVQVAAVA